MELGLRIGACLAAYLLGSFCLGHVLARRGGVNLRAVGSGNVGATNVARALGPEAGRWVLLTDLLKGCVPVAVSRALGLAMPWIAIAGVAAVIGHVFPLWHRFQGGKGAATAVGVLLGASPWAGLAAAASFLITKRVSHRASVGSLSAITVGATLMFLLHGWGPRAALGVAVWIIVVVRHAGNLRRLVRGEEPVT